MDYLPLSVIIITHRSDRRFEKCLRSVQFADEILIVDHNSGFESKEWSKELQYRVISHITTIKNFASVRNETLAAASHDWILFLDSDEVLSPDASEVLSKAIRAQENHPPAAFELQRKDIFLRKTLKHGEVGTVWMPRLMRRGAVRYYRSIHEIAQINGSTKRLPLTIHHHAHRSISDFIQTIAKYSAREAALRTSPDHTQPRWITLIELIIFPPAKFIQNYIFRLGFLDGFRGLVYAVIMSLHSFATRVMLLC